MTTDMDTFKLIPELVGRTIIDASVLTDNSVMSLMLDNSDILHIVAREELPSQLQWQIDTTTRLPT